MHPSARVERCVIGQGARIGPNAALRRVVVWDGASIDETLEDAIVTERGVVRI